VGNEAGIQKAAKAMIAFDDKEIARYEKVKKRTPNQEKALLELYQHRASMLGLITSQNNKAAASQTKHNKAVEAAATKLQNAGQRVNNLKNSITQLNQEMRDQLQSTFGNLFQGNIMQGPLGQVVNNINSTLQGFGAKSIPIPVSLILQDQKSQADLFDTFNKDIGLLSKKIPTKFRGEFVKQIMGMGTSAVPFMEGILKGTGAQQNKFVKNFVDSQKSITGAQKSPWNTQLTAANIQLQAAKANLAIAQGKLGKAKTAVATAGKPATIKTGSAKPTTTGTTRTTQGVTTNNNYSTTIHADGASQAAIERALAIRKAALNGRRARR